jgi:hypothetical protein
MLQLIVVQHTDARVVRWMAAHYSQPKGFVGRTICYIVSWDHVAYGAITAGSATRFLPGRDRFFADRGYEDVPLNSIINNTFYHVERVDGRYPCRWFTSRVLRMFRGLSAHHWTERYGDPVVAYESLVELPRTGDCYLRDGWAEIGLTKGFTCKREAGQGTDSWSGRRVWNTDPASLRPKRVLIRLNADL